MAASSVRIHPTAVVEPGAELGERVVIGPFCYVAKDVILGDESELVAQVTLLGPARFGKRNLVFPNAVLGAAPQDRSYQGEETSLEVGSDNQFREGVTVHRGTAKGTGTTRIGSRCLFMVGAHVAHDCDIADSVTLANLTSLGGHVRVGRGVVSGGHVAVAPLTKIGTLSFLAGGARVERDVPPFTIVSGDRARVRGINRVGLRRAGVAEPTIQRLERVYRALWASSEPLRVAARELPVELSDDAYVQQLLAVIRDQR